MVKKLLSVWIPVAVLAAIGYWVWTLEEQRLSYGDPLPWVPNDAALILQLNDPSTSWRVWQESSTVWQRLVEEPRAKAWMAEAEQWLLFLENDSSTMEAMLSGRLVVAFSPSDTGWSMQWGVPFPIEASYNAFLSRVAQAMQGEVISSETGEQLGIALPSGRYWFLHAHHGILQAGTAPLTEENIAAPRDSTLQAVARTTGNDARLAVYAHIDRLGEVNEGTWWSQGQIRLMQQYTNGWLALDLLSQVGRVSAYGFSQVSTDRESPTKDPAKGAPLIPLLQSIPASATSVVAGRLSLEGIVQGDSATAAKSSIQPHAEASVLVSTTQDDKGEQFWLLTVADGVDAKDALIEGVSEHHEMYLSHLMDTLVAADYWLDHAKQSLAIEGGWYAVVDQALVIGETKKQVRAYLAALSVSTLKQVVQGEPKESARAKGHFHILAYTNLQLGKPSNELSSKEPKFDHLLLTGESREEGLYYTHGFLSHPQPSKKQQNTLWETALKASPRWIQKVRNHYTRGDEILVQDTAHRLYLISGGGKVLWQRNLPEVIKGKVVQVDRYKNGKLQMVFNTTKELFLVDRLGRDVEGFPVALPTKATNAVTVMDYDRKREYRLLVACDDDRVYNYDIEGQPVKGWDGETDVTIFHPLWHFSAKNKDYIVCLGADGSVKALNRRGKVRLSLQSKVSSSNSPVYLHKGSRLAYAYLCYADTAGHVVQLHFNDEVKKLSYPMSGNKRQFLAHVPSKASENAFVFLDGSTLQFFGSDGLVYERPFGSMQSPRLDWVDQSRREVLVVDSGKGQAYWLDKLGKRMIKRPIKGETMGCVADLNRDGSKELVIGSGRTVMAYMAHQ